MAKTTKQIITSKKIKAVKTKQVLICPKCGSFDIKCYLLENLNKKYNLKKNTVSTQPLRTQSPQPLNKLVLKCQNWLHGTTQCGHEEEHDNLAKVTDLPSNYFYIIPNEYDIGLVWKSFQIDRKTISGVTHNHLIVKCWAGPNKYQFKGKSANEIVYKCIKDQPFIGTVRICKNQTHRYKTLSAFNPIRQKYPDYSIVYYSQTPKLIAIK